MLDALEIIKGFSRQTGIVDKNVDLLVNGLYKFPARQFLFTPFGVDPVYYTTCAAEERTVVDSVFAEKYWGSWHELGRGIGINNNPRKIATLHGISRW